jgi:hypothetical protein
MQTANLLLLSEDEMKYHHSSHQIEKKAAQLFTALFVILLAVFVPAAVFPQGTRSIGSDDFTRNRPAARPPDPARRSQAQSDGGAQAKSKPRRTYRLASQSATKSSGPGQRKPSGGDVISQVGITIWRLRPANPSDTRQLARENLNASEWISERIEADTLIRRGDRIRLSIESPRDGYLYIVDRDFFLNEKTGETNLIFPILGDDNRVYAGRLIDIPAPGDAPMNAAPAPNQIGEILTIVVTTEPLSLPISHKVLPITSAQLAGWEKTWGGESERFELNGGAGEARTREEQQAAAKRGTRQLTRDDPAPQTIYHVSTADNKAILVNVRLRYAK